ncbi:unnamed protein product, partial [Prorocentrum cordatum]
MAWSSYHAVIILEGVRAALASWRAWTLEQSTFQSSTSGAFLCVEGLLLVWALGGAARMLGTKGGKSGAAAKAGHRQGAASAPEAGTLQLVLAAPCGPSREPFASNALE